MPAHPNWREVAIMHATKDSSHNGKPEVEREIIRRSLDEIATNVGSAPSEIGLTQAVDATVPHGADAVATFATRLDPSDDDWSQWNRSFAGQ
jgi:hypothetical protein